MDLDDEELKATRKMNGLEDNLYEEKSNIEEDIEIVKSLIEDTKKSLISNTELSQYRKSNRTIAYKALEHLLLDYERQKQINEEHKKLNGELREQVKELEIDLTTVYLKGVEDGKNKYEQKIKEKIEELKKLIEKIKEDDQYSNEIPLYEHDIKLLEELLQESEDK